MKLRDYLRVGDEKTAREFARKAGVSIHAVRKWVRDERVPRPRTIMKIKKITKGAVTPEDWMMA